jgi:hypothetical protein
MKAKHWLIFIGIQAAGSLIGMGASHVDRVSWFVSFVLLLPGILVSLPLFARSYPGNFWPKWTIFVIAVAVNLVLFGILAVIRARRSKPEDA